MVLAVPSPLVPHVIGLTLVNIGQDTCICLLVRAKAKKYIYFFIWCYKKELGSDWSHLLIKMFHFFSKGQKQPLRILEKMTWEFTLVLLQTLMEFHQATQLMKKVDTQCLLSMPILLSLLFFPAAVSLISIRYARLSCFMSFAEMKRLLALSHERKFPSKWIKRVCRGEICMRTGMYHKAPASIRFWNCYKNFKWKWFWTENIRFFFFSLSVHLCVALVLPLLLQSAGLSIY